MKTSVPTTITTPLESLDIPGPSSQSYSLADLFEEPNLNYPAQVTLESICTWDR